MIVSKLSIIRRFQTCTSTIMLPSSAFQFFSAALNKFANITCTRTQIQSVPAPPRRRPSCRVPWTAWPCRGSGRTGRGCPGSRSCGCWCASWRRTSPCSSDCGATRSEPSPRRATRPASSNRVTKAQSIAWLMKEKLRDGLLCTTMIT